MHAVVFLLGILLCAAPAASGFEWSLSSVAESPVASESCASLLERYSAPKQPSTGPPRQMPEELVAGFTMDGSIELGEFFVDDTMGGQGSHYKYPRRDIDHMIKGAEQSLAGRTRGGRKNDHWIIDALKAHKQTVEGADVLIYGSMEPWYEALMIAMGAGSVTTVEYNHLTYDHPDITTTTPQELPQIAQEKGGFDVALSISSFDHDGLGRYGDPLEPNNDLRAMRTAACLLKPSGSTLIMTVPIGPDVVVSPAPYLTALPCPAGEPEQPTAIATFYLPTYGSPRAVLLPFPAGSLAWVPAGSSRRGFCDAAHVVLFPVSIQVWNLHRRYGAARLPWMLSDWEVKDVVGWNEELLTREANWRQTYEPVFVLAPKPKKLPNEGGGESESGGSGSTNKDEV
jgi:hypothetical protein